ncbi:MAG: hypothetical protein VYE73_17045 [Acidobacteriota bacterium]|nr:hypothetical protein [Acidobacteriota bacterium]
MSAHPLPRPRPTSRSLATIAGMTLDRFADAGLVVTVHSQLLDEVVLFASDNATVRPDEARPVYRAAALLRMLDQSARPTIVARPQARVA